MLWRVELFGVLRAESSLGDLSRFPTQKTAALFALLCFRRENRRVTREEAIDILWPDAELPAARDRLSQALVWLRRELEFGKTPRGTVLVTDRLSLSLDPSAVVTDVADFNRLLRVARTSEAAAEKIASLEAAVALYRGDFLVDQYDDWVLAERRRLAEALILSLITLATLHAEQQNYDRALEHARRAVLADSVREESHSLLIKLLAAVGQPVAAIRQFEDLRSILEKELQSEPSAALTDFVKSLRTGKPDRGQSAHGPVKPTATSLLPTPLTRFFGREREIADICRDVLTSDIRLLTLTGAGGSGKTRLALAAAARLRQAGELQVAFVPMADQSDAQLILSSIASALALNPLESAIASSTEQITEALSRAPYLLILDNLEHLIVGAAPIIRDLLERAPDLTILATSRQRIGLDGERELPVPPLPIPSASAAPKAMIESASAALFVDRAKAVRRDFTANESNTAVIAQLCARLEGIPLAIELCAAWAQTLTPQQMLEKLDRRFELLVSRRLDITPRHRTLRAAVEYGYLQLPSDLQRLFTRVSVFRGGWDLNAAVDVCFESQSSDSFALLAGLTELRERSLILAEEVSIGDSETEMRYRMLETLREFGGEQLTYADRGARRRRHAEHFLRLAEDAEVAATGSQQKIYLARIDREHDNLRTALSWTVETGEVETGLRLASALSPYWSIHGPVLEGYTWLRQLLDLLQTDADLSTAISDRIQAKAWRTLGHLAWSQANYSSARDAHARALALRRRAGLVEGVIESLYHLGITAYRQDDYTVAKPLLEESLALAQAHNDEAGIARVLLNLGNIAYGEGRFEDSLLLFQQTLELERRLGNDQRVADTMNNIGLIAIGMQDLPRASELFLESLAIYRRLTNHNGIANVLANLGTTTRLQRDNAAAGQQLSEGLKLAADYGNRFIMIHYFLQIGILESTNGNPGRGVVLIAAAENLSNVIDGSRRIDDADGYQDSVSGNRAALGNVEFDRLWALGQSLSLVRVVEIALSPAKRVGDLLFPEKQ